MVGAKEVTPMLFWIYVALFAAGAVLVGLFPHEQMLYWAATVQASAAVRNAMLDAIETTIGTTAVLKLRTGAQPVDVATADSGTVLATMTLPSDWMAAASGGTKAKSGTWEDLSADSAGTAAHWRLYASDGTTKHLQGSVGQGSGDLSLDNTVIAAGQAITVTAWTFTAGNP